jgi:predicted permease
MPLLKSIRGLFQRKRDEADMREEFSFHISAEIQKNIAAGMPIDEARRHALIEFGGIQQTREAVDEIHWRHGFETVLQDVRHGVRILRKSPSFTLVAVLTIALGVGATTAIFTTFVSTLYPTWGLARPTQLVEVREASATNDGFLISPGNFEDYRQRQHTFQNLSMWMDQSVNLTGRERPERLIGGFVSDNFFELLGVKPVLGRTFVHGEDRPGAEYVAVLGYTAWKNRFQSDRNVLGQKITLNNEAYTLIGVIPENLEKLVPVDVYVTAQHHPAYTLDRHNRTMGLMGRLKPGVGRQQARADLNSIATALAHDYPEINKGIHIEIDTLREMLKGHMREPLLILVGAVIVVLLIMCANLANLLLARGVARQKEIGVRAALGAARSRLIRQFFCESLLISITGGVLGVLVAIQLAGLIMKISPLDVDISASGILDYRALLFTLGVSMVAGILFGTAPALRFSKADAGSVLNAGTRETGSRRSSWLRSSFVVIQIALAVVLLVSSGLLLKSLAALINTSVGFNSGHLLTMEYRVPRNKYVTPESQANFHRQVQEKIQNLPGVVSTAYVQALPFSGNWSEVSFKIPGIHGPEKSDFTSLSNLVSPSYFATAQIPVLRGRIFSDSDNARSSVVVVVSNTFVRKLLAGQDPLGREILFNDTTSVTDGKSPNLSRATIVGVVGDTKQLSRNQPARPQMYFSYSQVPGIFGTLMIRTAMDPMQLADPVRAAVWSVDKDQPVWKVRTEDFLLDRDAASARFMVMLISAFGGLALLLSALGTYGLVNHNVQQRTRELGVRLALGAQAADVWRMVLWEGSRLAALGGLIGLVVASGATRLMQGLLYGVGTFDAFSFVVAFFGTLLVAAIATYIPARRATRIDPLIALRYE